MVGLQYPMQRYKFESNSQRAVSINELRRGCNIRCKDTNLKAIHNKRHLDLYGSYVAISDAKIQIWKQFTTGWCPARRRWWLQYPMQRYKFESNSQRPVGHDTSHKVAISDAKIQIWKQFTTFARACISVSRLQYPMQRYKFKSNSQPKRTAFNLWYRCNIRCKDTNLKAIHNSKEEGQSHTCVAISDAKIQIWKQFTTSCRIVPSLTVLQYPMQRYKFESNSQPRVITHREPGSCNIRCKDTNLKAIHNVLPFRCVKG